MFWRRSKATSAADTASVSGKTGSAIDNNNCDVPRSTTATSACGGSTSRSDKSEVQTTPVQQPTSTVYDDFGDDQDEDESLNGLQRMKRNLTVSRSGRYKSKSRPRPAVSAMQASASVKPSAGQALQSAGTGSEQSYVPSTMTSGGSVATSGFGAVSGVTPSGSVVVGVAVSSQYRVQPTVPRGLSTAL